MAQKYDTSKTVWQSGPRAGEAAQEEHQAASTEQERTSTEKNRVEIPFIPKTKEQDLEKGRQTIKQNDEQQVASFRKEYHASQPYLKYDDTMTALSSALDASKNNTPQGDLNLIYAAAKIFDPGSVVREGETATIQHTQGAIASWVENIKNDYGWEKDSRLKPETRAALIRELFTRANAANADYNRVRQDYAELAKKGGYDPKDVIGTHIGTPYFSKIEEYAKQHPNKGAGAGQAIIPGADAAAITSEGGAPSGGAPAGGAPSDQVNVGVLDTPPEGMELKGHGIDARRFGTEGTSSIVNYTRQPDATPEGYANLVADQAVAEGMIQPGQRDEMYRANLAEAQQYFKDNPAEVRKGVSGLSYDKADEAATLNAPLSEKIGTAITNIPTSAASMVEGPGRLIGDAYSSIEQGKPVGAVNAFAHPLDTLDFLTQKYRSVPKFNEAMVTDPLAIPGDIAALFSGAGAGLRVGGKLADVAGAGRVGSTLGMAGNTVQDLGRFVDPASWGKNTLDWLANPTSNRATRMFTTPASHLLGKTTGAGEWPIQQAGRVGFEAGRTGDTSGLNAFNAGVRDPAEAAVGTVEQARDAAQNLRTEEQGAYRAEAEPFFQNTAGDTVDLLDVRQRLSNARPIDYDKYRNLPDSERPASHREWDRAVEQFDQHLRAANTDPTLLNPENIDAFKKSGREVIGYDPADPTYSGSLSRQLSDDLSRTLRDRYPEYDALMTRYSDFLDENNALNRTFGLGKTRNADINPESTARSMQAATRNNANTGYGLRLGQLERLGELEGTGTMLPSMAGQALSPLLPRGIGGPLSGAAAVGGLSAALSGGLSIGDILAGLAGATIASPRLMGGLAKNTGRAAGLGSRGVGALQDFTRDRLSGIYDNPITRAVGLEDPLDLMAVTRAAHEGGGELDDQRRRWRLPKPLTPYVPE